MKVWELRRILANYPDELLVCMEDWGEEYREPCGVGEVILTTGAYSYDPMTDMDQGDFVELRVKRE